MIKNLYGDFFTLTPFWQPRSYGTFYDTTNQFYWDGLGRVVMASTPNIDPASDSISASGELIIFSDYGSVSFKGASPPNVCVYGSDLDITKILEKDGVL